MKMAVSLLDVLFLFCFVQYGFAELTVNVNPTRVIQVKGNPVMIDCTASGTAKTPIISWSIDGAAIQKTDDREVFANNTLYIKSLTKAYRGSYVCAAKVDAKTITAVVKVDIAILRKLPEIKDQFAFVPHTINISCPKPKRVSLPTPTVRWEIDGGKPLPSGTVLNDGGWSFTIKSLNSKAHTHNYTCIVENIAGVRKQSMQLHVYQRKPNEVLPKLLEVLEKKTASFKCTSLAEPPFPSKYFVWMKDGKEAVKSDGRIIISSADGTLRINPVLATDDGKYDCRIKMTSAWGNDFNVKGEFQLKVLRELRIDKPRFRNKQYLNLASGKEHDVICAIDGDGLINVTWKKKGSAALPSRMSAKASNNGRSLVIKDMKLTDTGTYECTAIGKYNTVTATVSVIIYKGPQFTEKPENVTVTVGETGKTTCAGTGIPVPKITWVRAAASNSALPKNFKVVKNKTMIVEKAELTNAGTYFCMLANGPTSISVEFEVIVNEAAGDGTKKPKKGQQSMGRTVGIAVGCAGAYIVLVIGLMIYCRSRRSRMMKRQGNVMTEIEDGEIQKDLLENGDEEYPMNGDLKILEKYHFPREDLNELSVLGQGKYGKVVTAKARGICEGELEMLVAMKKLPKSNEAAREAFDGEMEMLAQLRHENVIKLLGICVKDFPLLMITEYSEQGDLKKYLSESPKNGTRPKSMSTTSKLGLCAQIARAMEYLSANRVIHHDLACRNCIVMSPDLDIKVAFFSLSEDLYASDYYIFNSASVPLRWLSPEALFDEEYSEKSGVWAFGIVLWEIFSYCKQPYHGKTDEEVIKSLRRDQLLDRPKECPDEVFELMSNCFRKKPDERPKFADIVANISEIPVDSNV